MSDLMSTCVSWAVTLTYIGVSVSAIGLVALYYNQDRILYIPNSPGLPAKPDANPKGYRSPSDWSYAGGLATSTDRIAYSDDMLTTKDGVQIHVWTMIRSEAASDNAAVPTLIYFHGNAGNMGFRLPNAIKMFLRSRINVVMMDYRGYGNSSGHPNEVGLNLDAECVLDYVTTHPVLGRSPVLVFGRSLGGAVSVSLAYKYPTRVQGLVLENTFLSIGAMVDVLMPWLTPIKKYVLLLNWNSDVKIASLKQPILFVSGDADTLVPPFHMRTLYELAASSVKRDFWSVEGGTHNDTWEVAGANYYIRLKDFAAFVARNAGDRWVGVASDDTSCVPDDEDEVGVKNIVPTMGTDFMVRQ